VVYGCPSELGPVHEGLEWAHVNSTSQGIAATWIRWYPDHTRVLRLKDWVNISDRVESPWLDGDVLGWSAGTGWW
jgi:hypothetical protein